MKDVMDININEQFESNDKLAAKGRQRQMESEKLFDKINQANKNIHQKTKESKIISKPTKSAAKTDDTSLNSIRKKEAEQNKGIDEVLKKLKEEREKEQHKKGSLLNDANSLVKEMKNYGNEVKVNGLQDNSISTPSIETPSDAIPVKPKKHTKRKKRRLIEKEMDQKKGLDRFFTYHKEKAFNNIPNIDKEINANFGMKNIQDQPKKYEIKPKPIITVKKEVNIKPKPIITVKKQINIKPKPIITIKKDVKIKEEVIKKNEYLKSTEKKAKELKQKFKKLSEKFPRDDEIKTKSKNNEYLKNTKNKAEELKEKFKKLSEKLKKVDKVKVESPPLQKKKNPLPVNKKNIKKNNDLKNKSHAIPKSHEKKSNKKKKNQPERKIKKNIHKISKKTKEIKVEKKEINPKVIQRKIPQKDEDVSSTFSSLKKRFENVSKKYNENIAKHVTNKLIKKNPTKIIKKKEKKIIKKAKVIQNEDPATTLSTLKKHIQKGKEMSQGINQKPHSDDFSSLREEILKGKKLSQTYNEILNDFLDNNTNKVKRSEVVKLIKKTAVKKEKECHTTTTNKIIQSEDPDIAKLDALKEKTRELNDKINKPNTSAEVKEMLHPHEELKDKLENMRKKNNALIKKVEVSKELIPKDINDSYLTDLDFDKTIFNFLKIVYDNLGKEFAQLDKINQNVYGNQNGLLNSEGFIKITKKNFATIVRKAYLVNSHQELNYDTKLNQIYDFAYKTLIIQLKHLQTNPLSELRHLTERDVTSLQNKITMKTVDNQLPLNDSSSKVKVLVLEMLKNLPLILLTFDPNQKPFVATHRGEIKYSLPNSEQVYESSIVTAANSNNLRKNKIKTLIIGPNIRNMNQLKAPPGQGRKPVSRDGKVDPTEIFTISNWPDSCK